MRPDNAIVELSWSEPPDRPLAPWTYTNPEIFELEYEAFFLRRWQLVGHVSEVPQVGDFQTHELGRDSIFVLRGKDGELRGFKNVCRHRASRVLEGAGTCKGVVRCPYHGWTYQLDGSLMAIPQDQHFGAIDKSQYGLHEIQVEVFHGLIFVRMQGDGPSVADHFGELGRFFEMYDVENFRQTAPATTQVWNVNWKVAWDNYLENYHIPIGHPGLHRLLDITDEGGALSSGIDYGVFTLKSKPSSVEIERRYQELFEYAQERLPEEIRGKWVQFGVAANLGLDFYPEMLDLFQLIPLSHDKTMIRAAFYGHQDPSPEEEELRRLNLQINNSVNDEDRTLCERVQRGLATHGYRPGPLSQLEVGIHHFHEMVRELVPVAALDEAPARGFVASKNEECLQRINRAQ